MLTTSGIFGVTTETSVTFVFYFIAFGVVYAAIGGGKLFIDLAIRLVGRATGGSQKVAVVGSSLMGTITGSAVANVAAVGVFTIPLMRQSGVPAERAAATEAIASTGGQLMPPVMGVAAFVMAELLGVPYSRVALGRRHSGGRLLCRILHPGRSQRAQDRHRHAAGKGDG